jgi:hypothetical protein
LNTTPNRIRNPHGRTAINTVQVVMEMVFTGGRPATQSIALLPQTHAPINAKGKRLLDQKNVSWQLGQYG